MNLPSPVIVIPAELVTAAENTGLAADGVQSLKDSYAPHFVRFHEIAAAAREVAVGAPKKAREMRLELKAIRVAAEKTRKLLKEDSLRRGKAIDGICAVLEYQLVPVEKAMEEIERAEEIAEATRVAAIKAERTAALAPYQDPTFYDLGAMPAGQWEQLLAGAKAAHAAKAAAEAAAEAERVAAAKAAAEAKAKRDAEEAAERERMKAENARLAALAAEERKAREAAEARALAERVEAERKAKAERAEMERKAEAEREAAREERAEADRQAAADRAEAEHAAKLEREKREEAEAKLRRQVEADRQRAADEQAAAKRAAAAPDKQKIKALAESLLALRVPALTSGAAVGLEKRISDQLAKFVGWLEAEARKL